MTNKDTEAKRDLALSKGSLPLARGVQEIVWNKDRMDVYSGNFDHQICWTLIVAATKIIELRLGTLFGSVDELIGVHELLKAIDPNSGNFWLPNIIFTDYDFNRILRKNLSSENINKIVKRLPTVTFQVSGTLRVKMDDHWKEYEFTAYDNIAGVEVVKSGEKKRGLGAGGERRAYRLYFKSKVGLAFWQDITSGGYSLITNEGNKARQFLSYPGGLQQLVWATWRWADNKPAIRSLDQLFRIMGWKLSADPDTCRLQVKRLHQALDRLCRDGFLLSWTIDKKTGAYKMEKFTSANALKSGVADSPTTANMLAD
jgi:hypothetical protein